MAATIAAISSAAGSGAIGIVRTSGDEALSIVSRLFHPFNIGSLLDATPNMMYLGTFHGEGFSDKCLCVYFKAPRSYTGEDLVEIHCHGGVRVMKAVLDTLLSNGAIAADRGEFTKRALLNGKLSLTAAEGVADMINAESLSQLNSAFRHQSGELNVRINALSGKLLNAICSAEVGLDNPDEYESDAIAALRPGLSAIEAELTAMLTHSRAFSLVLGGLQVGIIGKVNRGKSSLFNALCGTNRAIVTPIEGTTRDTVSQTVEYNGYKLTLVDTAGLRESRDVIEQMGIERSKEAAKGSDVLLVVLDGSTSPDEAEIELLRRLDTECKPYIVVSNKSDLQIGNSVALAELARLAIAEKAPKVCVSALHGENVEEVFKQLLEVTNVNSLTRDGDLILSARHQNALSRCAQFVKNAREKLDEVTLDCIILDLQLAYGAVSEIDGSAVPDAVVEQVFAKFCVGK